MRRSALIVLCACLLFRAPGVWGQAAESGSIVRYGCRSLQAPLSRMSKLR